LATVIRDLVESCDEVRSRLFRRTWTQATLAWMGKWAHWPESADFEPNTWRTLCPHDMARAVRTSSWAHLDASDRTRAWDRYREAGFDRGARLMNASGDSPNASTMAVRLAYGVQVMIAMRIGSFRTARHLARRGVYVQEYLTCCPGCGARVSEDVPHVLVTCRRWEGRRAELDRLTGIVSAARGLVV
jgi:formate dehydrogenase maturation protein FdhE